MAAGLILYEDEDLLVVHKPAGINTHKPDRYAPDGLHEWLQQRLGGRGSSRAESPAARVDSRPPPTLAIHQRLDKETSGVMVFGKTTAANQSLARQFAAHEVRKEYLLLADRRPTRNKFVARSPDAVTEFEFVQPHDRYFLVAARPRTGKTHQIRRHAAEAGFPIVGDTKYGGVPAPRVMLHAHRLSLKEGMFEASVPRAFDEPDAVVVARECRELLFGEAVGGRFCEAAGTGADSQSRPTTAETNAFRLLSSEGVVVDWYDGHALVQWQTEKIDRSLYEKLGVDTVHEQVVTKHRRTAPVGPALGRFPIHENGLRYLVSLGEGLSTGIFLDQRENRRRLLTMNLTGKSVLNCFAYTCAFSVAAAKAGSVTTSVDLSRNYLEWGKDNFRANGLIPDEHEFVAGDVFDCLHRAAKRGQTWDVVILDPPTFSTTKKGRSFRAARDYLELETQALAVLAKGGTLLCSTNQRTFDAEEFETTLRQAARKAGRAVRALEFATLPWDFCVGTSERPYLKTLWAVLE